MKKRGISLETARKMRAVKGLKETRLQKMRYKRKMTQTELSEKSGVTLRMIAAYEQQTKPIEGARIDTLCDLSAALDCGIEDILEDRELVKKYMKVKGNNA